MNILIVKLSSLGDVVHAMPAVQDLRRQFPEAQIDWVVERGFAPLAARCAGVRRTIPVELRRWRKAPFSAAARRAWAAFKDDLQREAYDAVIDLQGLSKSALVAWLARLAPGGKRYALANRTDGSSYEAPTRWVADIAVTVPAHSHAVTRSRLLCAAAFGYALPQPLSFGLQARPLDDGAGHGEALALSREAGTAVAGSDAAIQTPTILQAGLPEVALVHGTSRADKQWPLAHWRALAARLNAAGYGVVLPHGSAAEEGASHEIAAGLAHARVWPRLALDALTDALGGCVGVIGVDSGLSHIAVALDLLHVQLYNFDTAWRTGPLPDAKRQRSVFDQPVPSVDAVWQAWCDVAAPTPADR